MSLSLQAYLLGIGVAVGSFIIKEMISELSKGIRFRKQLTIDLKALITGFKDHLPDLEKLIHEINSPEPSTSIIWDSEYTFLDHVYKHAHHLKSHEFQSCVRFYDILGKIPEIRKQYNKAVTDIITDAQNQAQHKKIAIACLKDLQKTYSGLIQKGCEVLIEIDKNHWFLDIDRGHFQNVMDTCKL